MQRDLIIICSVILLAAIFWFLIFVIQPLNFWLMISAATTIFMAIVFLFRAQNLSVFKFSSKDLLSGIFLALLLYLIFFGGKFLLQELLGRNLFFPSYQEKINLVYATKSTIARPLLALILIFPIGAGEELFWRGFIQKKLAARCGRTLSFMLTTFFYTAIHIFTLNYMLVLAAFVCGTFWGLTYRITASIRPVMLSHMLWDVLVFVILPFN